MADSGIMVRDTEAVDRLVDRLAEPRTAAALNTILDNVELLAVMIAGLDGLARKGEVIGDTLSEVLHEVRAAGASTGLDIGTTSRQLALLIPALAEATPAITRVVASPIVEPEPLAVLSSAAEAIVKGLQAAQANETKVGAVGLVKALRDDDVQRGIGFLIEVVRVFARDMTDLHVAKG